MKIEKSNLVTAEYQLFVLNEDGSQELMEATTTDNPLQYLHGVGMMMPKFEENLEGLAIGDTFEFELKCQDAYGEHSEENIIDLPMNVFTNDGTLDEEKFFVGAIVPLVDNSGERINAEIVNIGEKEITVDLNHPLAGENLYFKGKVLAIDTPTEEELQAMFGGGGCGGGCGCGHNHQTRQYE